MEKFVDLLKKNWILVSLFTLLGGGTLTNSFTGWFSDFIGIVGTKNEMIEEFRAFKQQQIAKDSMQDLWLNDVEMYCEFDNFRGNQHDQIFDGEMDDYIWGGYNLLRTNEKNDYRGDWYKTLTHPKYGRYKVHVIWRNGDAKFIYDDYDHRNKILKKDE